MRGHEPLFEMRMRGIDPAIVFIDLEPDRLMCWRDWHAVEGAHPTLNIDRDESIARLDLRCINGLTVSVQGYDERRVSAVAKACSEAGAKRVVCAVCAEKNRWGEPVLTSMTDTEGEAWRKS